MRMPSSSAVLDRLARAASFLLATVALACAASRPPASPPARRAAEEIRSTASLIERWRVEPVQAGELLRPAVLALHAAAGQTAPVGTDGEDPWAAANDAVARLRAARPELDDDQVVGLAVQAMAASLRDDSTFIGPEKWRRSTMRPPDERGGVGLVVRHGAPFPTILRALPGTPAAAAGVEAGSELRSVDGSTTSGLTLPDVVDRLAGPPGSEVRLTLGAPGGASRDVRLRRTRIGLGQVDCRLLGGRVLYLGFEALGRRTPEEVRRFAPAPGEPARWVILDLRGNTGGLLDAAIELADTFLASGPILSVESRRGSDAHVARPGTSPLERSWLVVLVDEKTGSGAEAVAAAVQDNTRGTVIGTRTAGAASVQQLYDMAGGALRLTVARLRRASGVLMDGRGVEPDVPVGPAAPPPETRIDDAACPGLASSGPVSRDPAVARAVSVLQGR
jgi:carboxyl-terminal processing protease